MASGTLFAGRCYAQSTDAIDAYYSDAPPVMVPGSTSYLTQYAKTPAGWVIQSYTRTEPGEWVASIAQLAPVPTLAACETDAEQFSDGQFIGWSLVLVMLAAWSYRLLKGLAK